MTFCPVIGIPGRETGGPLPPASAGGEALADATIEGAIGKVEAFGRPSKYSPEYCAEMVSYCSNGASLTSFAASIGVSRRTFKNWVDEHGDFAEALDVAKGAATVWWETRARKVADGEGGPGAASMIQFALKNLAPDDFSDRREVAYSGGINHNLMNYSQAVEEARRRGLPEHVLIAHNSDDDE